MPARDVWKRKGIFYAVPILPHLQLLVFYQDSSAILPYYTGVVQSIFWLAVSFFFFALFAHASGKVERLLPAHFALALLAFLPYIQLAEWGLKMMLYFFPCLIACLKLRAVR